MRDRATSLTRRRIYAIFAMGWSGSIHAWSRYRIVYGLLAGLATPLVISVHSIVSMDFAESQLSGWHSVIFPPYFVAGAIFSGFAMVLTLILPARKLYKLENVITTHHLDKMGKMLLLTGSIVTYSYACETFTAWYSGDKFEMYVYLTSRPLGPYAIAYWLVLFCNCVAPLTLWSRRFRTTPVLLFAVTIVIQVGMWLERYMLIVTSQQADFLPSSWALYRPSSVDIAIFLGTISFFLFLFLLFLRFVPFIPISELKALRHDLKREAHRA